MPNAYASLSEIRNGAPGAMQERTVNFDPFLLGLAEATSRLIDEYCERTFYPRQRTLYLDGSGDCEQVVPDLLSLTLAEYSDDNGQTYSTLPASNYYLLAGDEYEPVTSYDRLRINVNGLTLSYFPRGQRSLRLTGVWAYAEERDSAWLLSGDTVQNAPLAAADVSLTLNDVDAKDAYGVERRVPQGMLVRVDSEFIETTQAVDPQANTIGLVRGRNGTTAAAHNQNTAVYVWQPPALIKRATVVQVVRHFMRSLQGFGDARATPEIGELFFIKQLDPEVRAMIDPYRKPSWR